VTTSSYEVPTELEQLVRAMEASRRPGSELMWTAEAQVGRRFGIEPTVEPGLVQ
jgi:hypothetical protein